MECQVCCGSGLLLSAICPLCDGETVHDSHEKSQPPETAAPNLKLIAACPCLNCSNPSMRAEQMQAEQSKPQAAFWRHRWRIQKPGAAWTLSGHSRALVRTGFVIEELKVFLDAGVGWKNPSPSPSIICITHTHIDHCNALPMLLRTPANPAILAPLSHMPALKEMAGMTWSVKRAGWVPNSSQELSFELDRLPKSDTLASFGIVENVGDKTRRWVPVMAGDCLIVPQPQVIISVIRCFHTIEDVGYVLSESTTRLQGIDAAAELEYQEIMKAIEAGDKKVGRRIGEMKRAGRVKEQVLRVPRLAFLCDTTVQVFGPCPACVSGQECPFAVGHTVPCMSSAQSENQMELLLQCSTIIVECSFVAIGMDEATAEAHAIARGHVAWSQLRPIVENHSEIEFILVHFSERYTDEELREFFRTASSSGGCLSNVLLWLDEGLSRALAP